MEKERKEEPLQLDGEIWKPILCFEGLYEASTFGRIRNLGKGLKKTKVVIMKQRINRGYLRICLSKNGGQFYFMVHRLVYEAFNGRIPKFKHKGKSHGSEMLEINHKDENKLNNRLDNLELVTRTQNNKYGNRIKKAAATMSKRVYQYTKDLKLVKEWDSTKDCHRIGGFNQSMVALCCREKNRIYKGFLWSYVPL